MKDIRRGSKLKFTILILLTMLFSERVLSGVDSESVDGTDVANGGFALDCGVNSGVFLYDYVSLIHESPSWDPLAGKSPAAPENLLLSILDNYALLDEHGALLLKISATKFWENSIFTIKSDSSGATINIPPAPSPFWKDNPSVSSYKHCEIKQIAAHIRRPNSSSSEYVLDFELFKKMNPINQAMTVLHEIINESVIRNTYYELGDISGLTIELTKYISSLPNLANSDAETIRKFQLINLLRLQKLNYMNAQYGSYRIRLKPVGEVSFSLHNSIKNLTYSIQIDGNGFLKSAYLESQFIKHPQSQRPLRIGGPSKFFSSGALQTAPIENDTPVFIKIGPVFNSCYKTITFDEAKTIISCE